MSQTAALPPITEKAFLQQVTDFAKAHGWLVYHTWNSRHSAAGFPDLCMVRGTRIIFAELKTEKGKVTDAQREWLHTLGCANKAEVYVWRPNDWTTLTRALEARKE